MSEALTSLLEAIEALSTDGVIGSVLLLDDDGLHLRHGAAPTLPRAFVESIDGSEIGPAAGSCGTAAYRREPVIVTDIAADPLWADYQAQARAAGLRACWSTPIFSGAGALLGTFAMYYRDPRSPTAHDRRLIDLFVRAVASTIEQVRTDDDLRATVAALEHAHADSRFVLDLTTNAVGALDTDAMLDALVRQAVPKLADICIVDVLEGHTLRRAAAASSALEHDRNAAALAAYTPTTHSAHPIAVAASGRLVHGPDFRAAVADAGETDASHLEGLGRAAYVSIPLTARGATLGVFTLLATGDGGRFDSADIGLANDLARRIAIVLESRRLHDAAREAEERLSVLARAGEVLTGSLRVDAVRDRLFELTVPWIGDVCELHLLGDDATMSRSTVSNGSGVTGSELVTVPHIVEEAMRRQTTVALESRDPGIATALGGGSGERPVWVTTCPLVADAEAIGAVTVGGYAPPPPTRSVLPLLAGRVALALDNARRLARERTVAETLQRSLLPGRLPTIDGLELAACYRPGARGAEVGGDWYDVIRYEDGRTGLVMGDVVGRGIAAAVVMGTLRHSLRAFAIQDLGPARALDLLNRLVRADDDSRLATVFFGVFDPTSRRLSYVSAGHCPVVVARPTGLGWLAHGSDPPVGVSVDRSYREQEVLLQPGTTLVLYTDGLIERRDRDLADGMEALQDAVRSLLDAGTRAPSELCDGLVATLVRDGSEPDDVAVMAMHVA